ncbi:helix-turn-helix transcriptional regulator [Crocosphaera sp.]|uniref:helix-turn-helix domain-containing protein n=1 Tax=Crocosphaera sp. TaxID=2729996 RepID=UPI00261F5424|nr:helix-turn-helix transcriptional regulator [Crocosphaera sp.]MDJ0579046.1 helix-turn-helix transcriptional regulator [Crocosphaera sp.]
MATAAMKVRKTIETEVPNLGERIKKARKNNSTPLTALAAKAGMTTANWYAIEAEDMKALPLETLRRIEGVLGIDLGVTFDS